MKLSSHFTVNIRILIFSGNIGQIYPPSIGVERFNAPKKILRCSNDGEAVWFFAELDNTNLNLYTLEKNLYGSVVDNVDKKPLSKKTTISLKATNVRSGYYVCYGLKPIGYSIAVAEVKIYGMSIQFHLRISPRRRELLNKSKLLWFDKSS